jgi:hypothetical protein
MTGLFREDNNPIAKATHLKSWGFCRAMPNYTNMTANSIMKISAGLKKFVDNAKQKS